MLNLFGIGSSSPSAQHATRGRTDSNLLAIGSFSLSAETIVMRTGPKWMAAGPKGGRLASTCPHHFEFFKTLIFSLFFSFLVENFKFNSSGFYFWVSVFHAQGQISSRKLKKQRRQVADTKTTRVERPPAFGAVNLISIKKLKCASK